MISSNVLKHLFFPKNGHFVTLNFINSFYFKYYEDKFMLSHNPCQAFLKGLLAF